MSVRRDTSSNAALSIAMTTEEVGVVSMDGLTEEDEPVVSIDDALGPADDAGSEADLLDKPNLADLDHEGDDTTEVVTTVAVVCNGDSGEVGDNKRDEEDSPPTHEEPSVQSDEPISNGVQSDKPISNGVQSDEPISNGVQSDERLSAEVVIPGSDERHNSFTINATDPDGSTDNEDGDGSSLADSLHENMSPPPTTPSTPAITLNLAPSMKEESAEGTKESNGVTPLANGDAPKLSPPTTRKNDGRRRK